MAEFIHIEHSKTEGAARVTREAYDTVWKDKGWRIAKSTKSEDVDTSAPASTTKAASKRASGK